MKKKQESKIKAVPGEFWERGYNMHESNAFEHWNSGSDFRSKNPTTRATTQLKVNKEDH